MTPNPDMLHLKLNTLEALSHPKVLVAGDSYIAGTFCRTVNTGQFFEQMRECLNRLDDGPGTISAPVIQEAEDWLFRMREHKDCCGTPIVRKLLEALKG